MMLYLDPALQKHFLSPAPLFDQLMALAGKCVRHQKSRSTVRVRLGKKNYFIKQHTGAGWREICKDLLQLRLPILGAKNEWRAILTLERLGVPVAKLVGYGQRGHNPAKLKSFVLMEELVHVMSLEELGTKWPFSTRPFLLKRRLIEEIARTARILHQNGINHRDFYLCHFLWDLTSSPDQPKLYLIDLHRAQIRKKTPERWAIKDLAALYFSSKHLGLSAHDRLRFIKAYQARPLHGQWHKAKTFWQKVERRAEQLYQRHCARPRD